MNVKYTYDKIKEIVENNKYVLLTNKECFNTNSTVIFKDSNGYMYETEIRNVVRCASKRIVGKYNKYSIYNINQYLKNHKIPFSCISADYSDYLTDLEFVCARCGEHVWATWHNINKNDNPNRHHIICPSCDGRTESIHALVLKQLFKHEYPDTVEEEKSCRNPATGKILPTDIVNHRLKIAVEIQSQWHDFEDRKHIDMYKKQFWLDKGYSFYAPDIRDYTVLEMCQLFFDIDELPDYINYEYSNKINIKKVQNMLNYGLSVPQIESQLGINRHRIYDALYSGKLVYPENYQNPSHTPVIQLDEYGRFVREFATVSEACSFCGIKKGAIDGALSRKTHYSNGSYWIRKYEYDAGNFKLGHRKSKFIIPVNKFDKQGNYICSYNTIIDASKDCGVSNTQIYKVLLGELKQTGGYVFKRAA